MNRLFPYGLDAPPVVASLFGIAALLGLGAVFGLPHGLHLAIHGLQYPALGFACMGASMMWDSAVGKRRQARKLVDRLDWTGGERVLDVGCGLGLMAIAAAHRVPHGRVDGIDLWRARDLSGNGPAGVMRNARAEGVADRVVPITADMGDLPFADATFDCIVSRYAVHNLSGAAARAQAIAEIARVLRPGGQVLIDDIGFVGTYGRLLRECGLDVTVERTAGDILVTILTGGGVRPARVIVKACAPRA